MKEIKMLGVKIHPLTMSETVEIVMEQYIKKNKPLHLMGVNADKINQCIDDSKMMNIVNKCEIVNADGASVVLAGKYLGLDIPERVAGIDLMQKLLTECEKEKISTFFFGAKQEVLEGMIDKFKHQYPNLIVGGYLNGYFNDDQLDDIADKINHSGASIVFVGITSPRKELVIEYLLEKGVNCVFMGVGGSFDVLSGTIKRAPLWMQKLNLEWFFRMMNEPRRLFKRYFVGNTIFLKRIFIEKRNVK